MSVYEATVDPTERNTSHALILELVGRNKHVLDVGCASGYLAEALAVNDCTVSGIEYDEALAQKARPFLDRLVVADLNEVDLADQFPAESFDVVVFGDVLEHLLDPDAVLAASLRLLRPDGRVVISIPNVAHGSLRLALLQGRWNYTPTGLLDRTHIRFVTYDTLLAMLERSGLAVTQMLATVADALGTEVAVDSDTLPSEFVNWVREQPHAQEYQFVLAARRVTGDVPPTEMHAVPAVPIPEVRDVHWEAGALRRQVTTLTEQTERDREQIARQQLELEEDRATIESLRRQALTARDHAIGLEAQLGRHRAEIARLHGDLRTLHVRLAKSLDERPGRRASFARWIAGPHMMRRLARRVVGPGVYAKVTAPMRVLRRNGSGAR